MSPGRAAYEADVAARPAYDDGTPRKGWERLCDAAKWSWERDPRPREWRPRTEAHAVKPRGGSRRQDP